MVRFIPGLPGVRDRQESKRQSETATRTPDHATFHLLTCVIKKRCTCRQVGNETRVAVCKLNFFKSFSTTSNFSVSPRVLVHGAGAILEETTPIRFKYPITFIGKWFVVTWPSKRTNGTKIWHVFSNRHSYVYIYIKTLRLLSWNRDLLLNKSFLYEKLLAYSYLQNG